jgi:signal transduction histidine kinase
MSLMAVTGRLGHDGTVEHPAHWHRDQDRDSDPGSFGSHGGPFGPHGPFGPNGPFGRRGPGWLQRRSGHEGPPRRDLTDRLGGGVAAGIGAWRGFNPNVVRIVFVLATLVSAGWGVPLYVAAWLFMPAKDAETNIFSRARTDRAGIRLAVGLGSLLIFILLVAGALNGGWFVSWAWPQVFSVGGLVLIWRNASAEEQATLRHLLEPLGAATGDVTHEGNWRRRGTVVRLTLAGILLAGGLGWLFSAHASLALLRPLGGVLLVTVAIVLILGPWWLRIIRDLGVERQAKARAEERVDIASRVHDSVLQTLALIQRRADDPQKVVQLARMQERELRSWLFEGKDPNEEAEVLTVTAEVRKIQEDIESRYGVPVEAVTVGDCDLDDNLSALLAAAREATVNAAKWSGASVISLFAEVEPNEVVIVVRDRGKGFDPETVPEDRKGLAESVRGRMARRGGTAVVNTAPGEGTKITLKMGRAAAVGGRS